MNKRLWTAGFLGGTAAVIGAEIYAAARKHADYLPWTGYIVRHVPQPVAYAAIAGLSVWLPIHFRYHYRQNT